MSGVLDSRRQSTDSDRTIEILEDTLDDAQVLPLDERNS